MGKVLKSLFDGGELASTGSAEGASTDARLGPYDRFMHSFSMPPGGDLHVLTSSADWTTASVPFLSSIMNSPRRAKASKR